MIKNKKQMIFVITVFTLILALGGTTYAWFNYRRESANQELIAGNIYMHLNEGNNQITLTNVFPETKEEARAKNDNYITFNIEGINESTKTIYYEFILDHGTEKSDPNKSRYTDSDLRFDLVALDSNGDEDEYLLSNVGYDTLINKRIYVDTIDNNTNSQVVRRYKLRMWLDEGVIISDTDSNRSYTTTEYKNKYATIKLIVSGDFIEKSAGAYYDIKKNVNTTTVINFANISSDYNGKGLYILPGSENDDYPIYYYRGEINNNNVIFGGFCWQMVRTTDTGGIKMIYNGVVTGNGETCENTTYADRIISSSSFNGSNSSISDVGYMYNVRYPQNDDKPTNGVYFGTNVEYGKFDTNNPGADVYRLVDDGNGSVGTTFDETHHYSCNETTVNGICTQVRYYYYYVGTSYYYINLSNGETVEDALYKMTGNGSDIVKQRNSGYVLNQNNSTIKTAIENWFKTNLTNEVDSTKRNFVDYIEDTIYCNDRSFKTTGSSDTFNQSGWNSNGISLTGNLDFGSYNRFYNSWYSSTNVPSTICPNETDSFRVSSSVAHLNYPVGLLTADEIVMAGASGSNMTNNKTYYLYSNNNTYDDSWTISPSNFFGSFARGIYLSGAGYMYCNSVNYSLGVRPVISLKLGTEFENGGDGTPTNPYIVKYN